MESLHHVALQLAITGSVQRHMCLTGQGVHNPNQGIATNSTAATAASSPLSSERAAQPDENRCTQDSLRGSALHQRARSLQYIMAYGVATETHAAPKRV